jgi:hypothetical protein
VWSPQPLLLQRLIKLKLCLQGWRCDDTETVALI